MIKRLLRLTIWTLLISFLSVKTSLSEESRAFIEGIGTLEAFYAARGDTGYVNYLKKVKRQLSLDRNIGKHGNIQNAIFAETLIDLYIYSLSPASIDDSTKKLLFSTAEKFLNQCEEKPSKQCIELMKAVIHAYIINNQLLKAYLINEKLKQFISSEGIQDTFVYLLTLYNKAKLGVLMYNERIIKSTEQEIEKFLPYIPSPKYYPLIGFIYNALGVGKNTIATMASPKQTIKTLKKAERFLLQSNMNVATKKTLSIIYGNIGAAYLDLADSAITRKDTNLVIIYWDSAKIYIQKSLELAEETGNLLTVFYDRYRLATLKLQQGDSAQAYIEMMQVLEEAKKLGLNEQIFMPDLPEHLIYIARSVHKYDTALDMCFSLIEYYDSLEVDIINLASTFFKENIKLQERKEKAIQEAKSYSQRCNIIAIALGLTVFLIFAVWAWKIYKKGTMAKQN
ncbi:MAG: hypothetical protein GXO48_05920 [Chlorobi bacterium]|nr:hypothetical protein [Chlorobiota bacterium]